MPFTNTSKLKVGLTGYTGFIGKAFLDKYSHDYDIVLLNLRSDSYVSQLQNIDTVVHCAGLAHQPSNTTKEHYFQVNYELTKKLADQCVLAQVKHFIYLSTFNITLNNPTFYSESKIAAENYLNSLNSQIQISIVRPPMVYGENCKGKFPKLVKLIKTFPILPFNYDENRRSVIYIGNLTRFIQYLIDKKISGSFYPQDEKTVSLYELSNSISEALGKKKFFFKPPSLFLLLLRKMMRNTYDGLYGNMYVDPEVNCHLTGFQPATSTKEAIKKTVFSIFDRNT